MENGILLGIEIEKGAISENVKCHTFVLVDQSQISKAENLKR